MSDPETLPDGRTDPFQRYNRTVDWQDELYRQGAYKALDIPLHPAISADRTQTVNQTGFDGKAVAMIAGLAGGPVAALAAGLAWHLLTKNDTQSPVEPVREVIEKVESLELRFYDDKGNLIEVPRWQGNDPGEQQWTVRHSSA